MICLSLSLAHAQEGVPWTLEIAPVWLRMYWVMGHYGVSPPFVEETLRLA